MKWRKSRYTITSLDGTTMRRGLMRKHETGQIDDECDRSNRSYICKQCKQRCCWCFGGADDPRCDDCVAADLEKSA